MPILLDGQTYYMATETCRIVGISKNTLFRWIKKGVLGEVEYRDWRGWRLFNQEQIDVLKAITQKVIIHRESD
jgi:predicted site-specific integrase-resolvase